MPWNGLLWDSFVAQMMSPITDIQKGSGSD